ncbi:response regulator [Planctobacterium marinum]|uniref:response regulator n=1 Tax=Planctobacterium marinum TaxID=1631968 RepID=UPI001E405B48|nr:response regulator [Planctobacterium marinum]MCC2607091.1 response regulator [Planctobacterium marinum]
MLSGSALAQKTSILPKILVVDDQPSESLLVADVLSPLASIITASDGDEAFELCLTGKPDLVVMDIEMPRVDGISACRNIKHHEATAETPVMFLSASNDIKIERQCWEVGCTDYLCKPVERDIVQYRVKLQLSLKQHLQELRRITCFNTHSMLKNMSWFDCLLENQLQISARRELPLSLLCIEIDNVEDIINQLGYRQYDIWVTGLNRLLESLSVSRNHVVIRATRNRFYCLYPESAEESARHMAFMLFQQVYNKDALQLSCFSQNIELKVCALTNYAVKTRAIELLSTINKVLQDMADRDIVRGMCSRLKRRDAPLFEPLFQAIL